MIAQTLFYFSTFSVESKPTCPYSTKNPRDFRHRFSRVPATDLVHEGVSSDVPGMVRGGKGYYLIATAFKLK